jgi:hypothetical protein
MSDEAGGLPPDDGAGSLPPEQLRAVGFLAGADADSADLAGSDPETVAGWLDRDPEFVAALNRAKSIRKHRLRAEVRSLVSQAMATLRELVSGPDIPPAVRLRACMMVLQAAKDSFEPDTVGPTTAAGVEEAERRQEFYAALHDDFP